MRLFWCLVVLAVTAVGGRGDESAAPVAEPVTPLQEKIDWMPKIQLRGRIQADAVMASQSEASRAEIGPLQDGYGLRRARLGAQGTIDSDVRWVAEVDFAGGKVALRDMFVGLTALPGVDELHIGYFREPFSLDGATSSNVITFMERSPLNELDPTRDWGIAGYWFEESGRGTFAIGAFRVGTDNGQSTGNGGNWAVTARGTLLPLYVDTEDTYQLLHIGAAFSYRVPLNGEVVISPGPQSNLLTVEDNPASPFLPTVTVPASSLQLYDLQAALVLDSFSLQGEWIATTIQQHGGGVVFLHGVYAFASCFLTGEHRGYNTHTAGFDKLHVLRPLWRAAGQEERGFGAVELAARFSVADFASSNLPVASSSPEGAPPGTILYEATFGANWYLNDNTRVMFDYTLAVPAVQGGPALPVHVFAVRTAVFW